MTQINPNINQYNVSHAQQQQQPVRIPNYYYTPDALQNISPKDTLKENLFYEMVLKPFVEHPIATFGTWLGLSVGLDWYSNACSGNYENSLLKKIANCGDKVQESKLIQNKPAQAVLSGANSVKKLGAKAVENSAILRAMRDTPSMPEWGMVKTQMFNQKQEVVQDFIRIADGLGLGEPTKPIKLKEIGLNSFEKNMLKKTFGVDKISKIPEAQAVNQVLLDRLGRTPEQIKKIHALGEGATAAVKQEILKDMGLDTKKLKLIKEDMFGKHIDDVVAATKNVKGRVKIGAGHYKWMGVFTKPFERTIGCDEIYNRLHSMSGGARTGTGRFCTKATQMLHRGFTFGGGKLGVLIFIAPILVETAKNVKKADKDQKVGTAVGNFLESISWVFTFPIALKMMHSFGGIKYAGLNKDQVAQIRKIKEDFNAKNGSGVWDRIMSIFGGGELKQCQFKNKAEYDVALSEAKLKIKNITDPAWKKQNIFTKGIRKLVGCLTPDLECFKGYRGGGTASKAARGIPGFFKNFAGIPIRLAVFGVLSSVVLDGILKKCITTIFGKSYDAMKADEHKEEKKAQKQFLKEDLNNRIYAIAQENAAKNPAQKPSAKQYLQNMLTSRGAGENSNLIPTPQDKPEEKVDNYTYIPSSENIIPQPVNSNKVDNYTYIPKPECTIKSDKVNESQRKYIPSQAAANINKTFDNSGLTSALDRAQRAEDKALRVLAGNFEGM